MAPMSRYDSLELGGGGGQMEAEETTNELL